MSSIATCPECAAQLALPDLATASDQVQCPECQAEFLVAEGDQRWLSTAKIVEPEQAVPESPPPVEEAELPKPTLVEQFSQELQNAGTIASPASPAGLADWEDRLRSAIESTAEQSDGEPVIEDPPARAEDSLEDSPEFEFVMDPPAESSAERESVPSAQLSETTEWFESTSVDNVQRPPEPVSEAVAEESETAAHPAKEAKPRRTKNSPLMLATVFLVCGAIGTALGQYALLWLLGPSADYLGLAQFVSPAISSPADSQSLAQEIAPPVGLDSDETTVVAAEGKQAAEELLAEADVSESRPAPPLDRDEAVLPAVAELPDREPPHSAQILPPTNTTPQEFSQRLATANEAASNLVQGDLNTLESKGRKGHAYITLCALAERLDFASADGLAVDEANLPRLARSLFRTLSREPVVRRDLPLIAQTWWRHQDRPNQGCFLMGRVSDVQPAGPLTLYQLVIESGKNATPIPILLTDVAHRVGDEIGVVGTIVSDPQAVLSDFRLRVSQVVVAHDSFDLNAE